MILYNELINGRSVLPTRRPPFSPYFINEKLLFIGVGASLSFHFSTFHSNTALSFQSVASANKVSISANNRGSGRRYASLKILIYSRLLLSRF